MAAKLLHGLIKYTDLAKALQEDMIRASLQPGDERAFLQGVSPGNEISRSVAHDWLAGQM